MNEPEMWADVPRWEGLYRVSNRGRVEALDRDITQIESHGVYYTRRMPGRILKPFVTPHGYHEVKFYGNGNYERFKVHRLVLTVFFGDAPPGTVCCHNDGNPLNNCVTNLRWDTQGNNNRDKNKHGTMLKEWTHPGCKISDADAGEIRKRSQNGERNCDLAVHFGISRQHVCGIIKGRKRNNLQPMGDSICGS